MSCSLSKADVHATVIVVFQAIYVNKVITDDTDLVRDLGLSTIQIERIILGAIAERMNHVGCPFRISESSVEGCDTVGDVADVIFKGLKK